jgi:hypothetical protein
MENNCKMAISQQFGASIDMFEKALLACPDELWEVRLWDEPRLPRISEFWNICFHTLFWLDLYLSGSVDGFLPPAPFTLDELDPAGVVPERPFSKVELQDYLEYTRKKCQATIEALTAEQAQQKCVFPWGEVTYTALLLDNMRHVQEHAAQLNLILGQKIGWAPRWITNAKKAAA